jgi:hypothetical protein
MMSMGMGKIMVEFFSAEMLFKVCRYRNCRADGLQAIISDAAFSAALAFCSPSAAITCSTSLGTSTNGQNSPWPWPPWQPPPLPPWPSAAAPATSHPCCDVKSDNNATSVHQPTSPLSPPSHPRGQWPHLVWSPSSELSAP